MGVARNHLGEWVEVTGTCHLPNSAFGSKRRGELGTWGWTLLWEI